MSVTERRMARLLEATRRGDASAIDALRGVVYAPGRPKSDEDLPYVVALAKSGNSAAINDLYERFEFFLLRFRSLLKAGKFDGHPMVRQFLALYVEVSSEGGGRALRNALLSRKGMNWRFMESSKDLIGMLREQLSTMDDDDIDSIINVTFFQCLSVYDPKGKVRLELKKKGVDYDGLSEVTKKKYDKLHPEVGFHGFMYNYFHYLLRKNIDKEIRGVMPGSGWCDLYADHTLPEFENSSMDPEYFDAEAVDQSSYQSASDQSERDVAIDHDWVEGSSAQWPFDILTPQERWIIKARFYDRMFACDIADRLGISTSAIRNRIRIAKEKLLEEAGEDLKRQLEYEYTPSQEYVKKWYAENNKPLARLMGIDPDDFDSQDD